MKIPIGIFFGGATFSRDHSLQSARRVYEQLRAGMFDPRPIFVDPFGQLILLEGGIPAGNSIAAFYPSDTYFTAGERERFSVSPEQLGKLGPAERAAMARGVGQLLPAEQLPQHISLAFLTLPDVEALQTDLDTLKIPYTGESADLLDLCADRYGLRLQLQQHGFESSTALRLTARSWQKRDLQAIWGEDTATVAYPLLLRPSHQHQAGRSTVVTSKDGPEGLRRAIDLAFGQRVLPKEQWLEMSPVDREDFLRQLTQWSSGIAFPLELDTGTEKIVFQRPQSLLDYLKQAKPAPEGVYTFRSQRAGEEILVSSLPEGTALSCLLLRAEEDWQDGSFRLLGSARGLVTGTESFPIPAGPRPRISESMAAQVFDDCRRMADQLSARTGLRIFGVLAGNGQFIPEEIQPFTGPVSNEVVPYPALKDFIIASLQARLAERPEPAYRALLATLSEAEDVPAVTAETVIAEAPPVSPIPPPPAPEPAVRNEIYQRELKKLDKEKKAKPESMPLTDVSSPPPSPQQWYARWWAATREFVSSRIFLRNLGAMAAFVLLLFLLLNMGLRVYTKHGDSMQLEDYTGLLLEDARRKAKAKGLKMEVISQSFQPGKRANEIFAQYPEPLSQVKENRTVFVSVYQDEGKEITLPAFTDAGDDIDNYRRELGKRKIRLLVKEQVFDGKLAEGTILHLLVDGEKITNTQLRQGQVKVKQGEAVEAVISTRTSKYTDMPNVVCQRFDEARFEINGLGLVVGRVYGVTDGNRDDYWVWKQEPAYQAGKLLDKGAQINIYLTRTRPDGCGEE